MKTFTEWLTIREGKIGIPIKIVRQSHGYDCGAAALRAIAQYFRTGPDDEKEFIKLCDAGKRKGTHPEDIVKAARRLGLHAVLFQGMTVPYLKSCLRRKKPVICAIQAWGDERRYAERKDGHYVVAIGCDRHSIYFEDPAMKSDHRGFLSFDDFDKRWHDQEFGGKKIDHLGIVIWKNIEPKKEFAKKAKEIP